MTTFVVSPLANDLADRLEEAIQLVRSDPPEKKHVPLLRDTVLEATDVTTEFFFLEVANRMKLGKWATRIVNVGLKTTRGGLHMIIKKVVKGLDDQQLNHLVGVLEAMILRKGGKAYLGFPITDELTSKLRESFRRAHEEPPPKTHAAFIVGGILEMADVGLDFYFLESLQKISIGKWGMKTVDFGLTIAKKAIHAMLNKVLPVMGDKELLSLTGFVEEVLFEGES